MALMRFDPFREIDRITVSHHDDAPQGDGSTSADQASDRQPVIGDLWQPSQWQNISLGDEGMSEQSNRQVASSPGDMRVASRRPVAVFNNYADAERAVDRLSDLGFPVERTAIVGHDLTLVEQVTGRANYLTSALRGAASGALPGVLIGWLFGLFDLVNPLVASLVLAFYGLIIGAALGALLGVIMYALQRGRRDFHAVTLMVPSRYEVIVDPEVADEAARLLAAAPAAASRPAHSA